MITTNHELKPDHTPAKSSRNKLLRMIVQLYDQPAQSSEVAYYMCGQCVATTCITD